MFQMIHGDEQDDEALSLSRGNLEDFEHSCVVDGNSSNIDLIQVAPEMTLLIVCDQLVCNVLNLRRQLCHFIFGDEKSDGFIHLRLIDIIICAIPFELLNLINHSVQVINFKQLILNFGLLLT